MQDILTQFLSVNRSESGYMNSDFYAGRFDSIQAMRGLAALSVIFHHIAFIENGSFGVDIFFCISGFIMMYVTHISAEKFIIKRLIRIVPLYYCITFATFAGILIYPSLFDKTVADPVYLLKSCLFLTPLFGGPVQPVVKVGWTLNYEMLFYFVIWAAMHISKRYRGAIASFILVWLIALGWFMDIDNTIMFEFIYGILAYELLKRLDYGRIKNIRLQKSVIMICAAMLCFFFMVNVKYLSVLHGFNRIVVYGIPSFVLFVLIFAAGYGKKIPRFCIYLGNISYSMYLMHYFIARFFNKFGEGLPKAVVIISVVGLSVAAGSVSFYVFERKFTRWLRTKTNLT